MFLHESQGFFIGDIVLDANNLLSEKAQLYSGDTIELKFGEIENLLQRCCECGFWHLLKFEVLADRVRITFEELSMESPEIEESVQDKLIIHRGGL